MKTETIQEPKITEENVKNWTMDQLLKLKKAPTWACAAVIVNGDGRKSYAVRYYECWGEYMQDMEDAHNY